MLLKSFSSTEWIATWKIEHIRLGRLKRKWDSGFWIHDDKWNPSSEIMMYKTEKQAEQKVCTVVK